jgi:hypothetical protein
MTAVPMGTAYAVRPCESTPTIDAPMVFSGPSARGSAIVIRSGVGDAAATKVVSADVWSQNKGQEQHVVAAVASARI